MNHHLSRCCCGLLRSAQLAVCAVVLLCVCGCRKQQASESPLVCYVGGTMRPAMEKLAKTYTERTGRRIEIDYAGSGELLARIQNEKRGDLYVCHDPFLDILMQKKLGRKGRTVAVLTPVIVVQKGNPKNIRRLSDLVRPDVRVILTDYKYSTLGNMLAKIFEKAQMDFERVKQHVRKTVKSGGQAANDVKIGGFDAAIVWNAVAHLRRDGLDIVPISPEHLPQPGAEADAITSATGKTWDVSRILVTIATLRCSKMPDEAEAFASFVAGSEGAAVFRSMGFTPAPAEPATAPTP